MCTNQESGGKHILIWTFCKIKFFAEVSTKYNIALKSLNSALIYHTEKEQLIWSLPGTWPFLISSVQDDRSYCRCTVISLLVIAPCSSFRTWLLLRTWTGHLSPPLPLPAMGLGSVELAAGERRPAQSHAASVAGWTKLWIGDHAARARAHSLVSI